MLWESDTISFPILSFYYLISPVISHPFFVLLIQIFWQLWSRARFKILKQRRTCFIHLPIFKQSFFHYWKQEGSPSSCGCLDAFRKWLQLGLLKVLYPPYTHKSLRTALKEFSISVRKQMLSLAVKGCTLLRKA